jgi:hypothetical protein
MRNKKNLFGLFLIGIILISGCASRQGQFANISEPMNLGRIQTFEQHGVTLNVSIPADDDAARYFGIELAGFNIQPIWVRIENNSDVDYWLLPNAIDPDYYSADEVAILTGKHISDDKLPLNREKFRSNALPFYSAAGSVTEGYIYATHARGGRLVDVRMKARSKSIRVRFAVLLPTEGFDYEFSDLHKRYAEMETLPDLTVSQLRQRLNKEPCCTTNQDGSGNGDPLNVVLIGSAEDVIAALSSSGWTFTESITIDSIMRMVGAAIEEKAFPSAPVSALYAYGRKQDIALQRGRSTISQRNHMRLWLAPYRCEGQPVWVGQVSRDIGVKLTSKSSTLTTHVIDPVVDESREYLLDSLLHRNAVSRFAFVKGVGEASHDSPRVNLMDDPYFTDGYRLVAWISRKPVSLADAIDLNWNDSADPVRQMSGKFNHPKIEAY